MVHKPARTLADLDEEAIVARIVKRFGPGAVIAGARRGRVRLGIGDDTALLAGRADRDVVIPSDTVVEGVDFLRERFPPAAIGHRALVQNLSDLAAMGATPVGFTLALIARPQTSLALLDELFRGIARQARAAHCPLIGGDLSSTQGPLTLAITAIGEIERGAALTRSGVSVGDDVWISGELGGAALGLAALLAPDAPSVTILKDELRRASHSKRAAIRRTLYPTARIALGRALLGKANACIDLSDGLYRDASRLAAASHVGIVLEADTIPVANGARLDQALASGEEYELLFSAHPRQATAIRRAAQRGGVFVTRIGYAEPGRGVEIAGVQDVTLSGFDHFANSGGNGA